MNIKLKVKKNFVENTIREFLKKNDVSSVDMIRYLSKALGHYISKYKIGLKKDLEEELLKNSEDSILCLAYSLQLLTFVQDKILEQKGEL